jgi:hypothetical protein
MNESSSIARVVVEEASSNFDRYGLLTSLCANTARDEPIKI